MYTPAYHAFNDIEKMRAHIAAHPLGAWVCHAHASSSRITSRSCLMRNMAATAAFWHMCHEPIRCGGN